MRQPGDTRINLLLLDPCEQDIFPPPALGYLRAFLQQALPSVHVDLTQAPGPEALPASGRYDIVGITVHSFAVPNVAVLLPELRRRFPAAWFVAGGHHASALPEQMLAIGFDQGVVGPGEQALVDVVRGNRERVVHGMPAPHLDSLPFPDYSGLRGSWSLPLGEGGRALPIISSRGCPYQCAFCASSNFWQRRWYARSPKNVVQEIRARLEVGEIDSFMFEDDNFTLRPERAVEICDRIAGELLPRFPRLRWHAASRAESLVNEKLCASMARAGCSFLWLGIESGSPRILQSCRKGTTVENMFRGIEVAHAHGLKTIGQFIVGLPGEDRDSIEETRRFISRAPLTTVGVNKAWVLPGTYLYDFARHHGLADDAYLKGVPFFTFEHPEAVLRSWVRMLRRAKRDTGPRPWVLFRRAVRYARRKGASALRLLREASAGLLRRR